MAPETTHWSYHLISTIILLTDLTIRIGLSVRVIMRKRSYGVSLAWLVIILLVPFVGALCYLFLGENRLSDRRAAHAQNTSQHYQRWLATLRNRAPVAWSELEPKCSALHHQADTLIGIPALAGNRLHFLETTSSIMRSLIADINNARSTCHLQFYIWQPGGVVDDVAAALKDAARRGVTCRILVDGIGSSDFLQSDAATSLRRCGIIILESLPTGLIKALFARIDIRNHRKIVVIDGKVAYTGSQNMVDPRFFKQGEELGQWIDLMVRIEGPVVETLAGTFISDWFLETETDKDNSTSLDNDIERVQAMADVQPSLPVGDVAVQLVPSGPGFSPEAIHSLLLTTIYAAQKALTLTTPYFVPDEAILTALKSAAHRGVDVRIIVPKNSDSSLVQYASRARYESLLRAGVHLFLYEDGLLHTKTITIDDDFALLGSVNLDMRSFWLNFEATLFIYNQRFTEQLRKIQQRYEQDSHNLQLDSFTKRPVLEQFLENSALLIGPLL